jgi:predicted RNA binding protein YcfA (HicA-like mRNA interferase family)
VRAFHEKLLSGIFAHPVRASIKWHDVESLLVALGAELKEARGSRVSVVLNDRKAVLHRPHPRKEVSKGMLRGLRGFLIEAGIKPPD